MPSGRPAAFGRRPAINGNDRTMIIGLAVFDLQITGARGLKDKRMVLRSIKSRLQNEFKVSVAETNHQDRHQRAELAVAAVGPDQVPIDELLQHILSFVESHFDGEVLAYRNEFIHV
jgi:uncharacterized protein